MEQRRGGDEEVEVGEVGGVSPGKLRAVGSTGRVPNGHRVLRLACDKDQTGHRVKIRLRRLGAGGRNEGG